MTTPYLYRLKVTTERRYNPTFGDDKVCLCGHAYYRHFDSYENMDDVGCKYCPCDTWTPPKEKS